MVCARCFFFSSRRRHTRCSRDWSSDVCSSDLILKGEDFAGLAQTTSEDPGSAAQGGDLGWNGPGTFAPEFERVITGLKDKDRKSTRLNSSHGYISYAVFCLKKKKIQNSEHGA